MQYPFKDWLSPLTKKQSLSLLEDFGSKLLSSSRRPDETSYLYAPFLIAEGALAGRHYKTLCSLSDLYDYTKCDRGDADVLATLRQLQSLFQKNQGLDLGIDTEEAGLAKFLEAEKACKATNDFFRCWESGRLAPLPPLVMVLDRARRLISHVLGKRPSFSRLPFCFGPGATTTIKQKQATIQQKLAESPTCSESLARSALLPSLLREIPHWLEEHQRCTYVDEEGYEVAVLDVAVETSRLVFVPKTAFVRRTIITQPTLNSFMQLGIGNYIAKRLKRNAGIDIEDQTLNQRLALAGSLTGELATVDLSSASDTISIGLVKYLLPHEWYELLNAARCQDYIYGGNTYRLEHFSAMGNGFTFPLETLIFWALARCTVPVGGTVSAYGDDIIIPSRYFEQLRWVLQACGFTVNTRKSFATGNFRESCGADFFFGIDIRPYYVKNVVNVESLFTMHNFFFRANKHDLAEYVRSLIPVHLRRYGPDGYGDGHLLTETPFVHCRPTRASERRGWGGTFFKSFRRIGERNISLYPGDYISPLYVLYVRGSAPTCMDLLKKPNSSPPVTEYAKDWRPYYPRRGTCGYEEVSIYTFLA